MKLQDSNSRRSDEIRRRKARASHSSKVVSKKRADRVISSPPPPVLVRTPLQGISQPVTRGTKKNRKFYNYGLDSTFGTEIRLPALPGINLSWKLVSLILVAFLGSSLYFIWDSPSFRIEAPRIEGLNRISSNQVISELRLLGQPIFLIDPLSMKKALLKSFPEFFNAEVKLQLPNEIVITVTERIPVLIWMHDGESVLVDAQGITFPHRGIIPAGSYPIIEATEDPVQVDQTEDNEIDIRAATISKITGVLMPALSVEDQVKPLISAEMVKSILIVSEQAPDGSKLLYDPIHGLGWTDRRGWNVYLGDAEDMEIKIQIYRAIMERLKKDEVRPTYISVQYVHAPYFRIEE